MNGSRLIFFRVCVWVWCVQLRQLDFAQDKQLSDLILQLEEQYASAFCFNFLGPSIHTQSTGRHRSSDPLPSEGR